MELLKWEITLINIKFVKLFKLTAVYLLILTITTFREKKTFQFTTSASVKNYDMSASFLITVKLTLYYCFFNSSSVYEAEAHPGFLLFRLQRCKVTWC